MGTIINDFYNKDKYPTRFDDFVENFICSSVKGIDELSDYNLANDYYIKIANGLLLFSRLMNEYKYNQAEIAKAKEDLVEYDKEYDIVNKAYQGLKDNYNNESAQAVIATIKRSLDKTINKRENELGYITSCVKANDSIDKELDSKSVELISLYKELIELHKKMEDSSTLIITNGIVVNEIKHSLKRQVSDPSSVDYFINQLYKTIEQEINYYLSVYDGLKSISGENVTIDNVLSLEYAISNVKRVNSVLSVKKELLASMYYKILDNKKAEVDAEVKELDSATTYMDLILSEDKGINLKAKRLLSQNKDVEGNDNIKTLSRRLNNVYLSHNTSIRVVK